MDSSDRHNERPLLSIIIPTYNRPLALERCIESLVNVKIPSSSLEVIVVDDGSEYSRKTQILSRFGSDLNIIYLREKNGGPARARNVGSSVAQGVFLVFLDDDCTLPKDWYDNIKRHIDDRLMLTGQTINKLEGEIFPDASQDLTAFLYSFFNSNTHTKPVLLHRII